MQTLLWESHILISYNGEQLRKAASSHSSTAFWEYLTVGRSAKIWYSRLSFESNCRDTEDWAKQNMWSIDTVITKNSSYSDKGQAPSLARRRALEQRPSAWFSWVQVPYSFCSPSLLLDPLSFPTTFQEHSFWATQQFRMRKGGGVGDAISSDAFL